jgi:predicted phosphodiesterase
MGMNKKPRGKHLFRFALIADSHLNPVDESNTSPWQTNHLANPRNEVVVDAVNRLKPAFTVHLGDVVHPLPYTSSYKGAAEYANNLYQKLNHPFYITPGNHDIGDKFLPGNPAATITQESCNIYENFFGKQWQTFERDGVCFIILNSCLFGSASVAEGLQWKWFEKTLSLNSDKRIFLFSHYPPFITERNEENNYDNIEQEPRARLLDYIEKYQVEAIFAGHVHTFFLNEISSTLSYALPSSTNFRQDYAEIFRVNPAQEFGRNDVGKFGFFIVDIYEDGHISRFARTNGSTEVVDAPVISHQIEIGQVNSKPINISVDMCHEWCEVLRLPYNPPLDAFTRKKVRNDYSILNLWDCGIEHIRIPVTDISDDQVWERVKFLSHLGVRFTVFTVSSFSKLVRERLSEISNLIHAFEMISVKPDEKLVDLKVASLDLPVYFSPIYIPPSHSGAAGPYDHTMASGYFISELSDRFQVPRYIHSGRNLDGIVVRVPYGDSVLNAIAYLRDLQRSNNLQIVANICLLPNKSSINNNDDDAISLRVAEACFASLVNPEIHIRLDTFIDIDRGYFLRHGLFDRRHNPRKAGLLVKHIKDVYGVLENLNASLVVKSDGVKEFHLKWGGGSTQLQLINGTLKEAA